MCSYAFEVLRFKCCCGLCLLFLVFGVGFGV